MTVSAESTKLYVEYGVSQLKTILEIPDMDKKLRKRAEKMLKSFEENKSYYSYNRAFAKSLETFLREVESYEAKRVEEEDQMELF